MQPHPTHVNIQSVSPAPIAYAIEHHRDIYHLPCLHSYISTIPHYIHHTSEYRMTFKLKMTIHKRPA